MGRWLCMIGLLVFLGGCGVQPLQPAHVEAQAAPRPPLVVLTPPADVPRMLPVEIAPTATLTPAEEAAIIAGADASIGAPAAQPMPPAGD
ncbi:MAG TPA: hypothetical protein PKC19_02460 [Roseiflexaceae bacterium]|nr:hypothetical protein [Roseiflexaceae bacterium]